MGTVPQTGPLNLIYSGCGVKGHSKSPEESAKGYRLPGPAPPELELSRSGVGLGTCTSMRLAIPPSQDESDAVSVTQVE